MSIQIYFILLSVRIQIQEVTDVMRDNVKKVMERGERLEDLQDASDRLTIAGTQFREAAKKAQRRAWLQNVKSRIIIVSITLTIVLFIVGTIDMFLAINRKMWIAWSLFSFDVNFFFLGITREFAHCVNKSYN